MLLSPLLLLLYLPIYLPLFILILSIRTLSVLLYYAGEKPFKTLQK